MVDLQDIKAAAEAALREDKLFLVEVKGRGDEFEVTIDSDDRVTVEDCVLLTKAIEGRFDRDLPENDFSLTVSSAGIGQPLRVARQYRKLVGRAVEVLLASGTKIVGTLEAAEMANDGREMESITLSYPEKQRPEGQKRPQIVTVTKTFPLSEVKTTSEHIDFK